MRRGIVIAVAAVAAGLLTGALGAQQGRADVALRAAIETETVRGDLKGAIEQYKRLVEAHKDNRQVAVQALLRMAQCFDTLGSAEARNIYERVLREYADQTDAVGVARRRMAATSVAPAEVMRTRQVWAGPEVDGTGTISPDGRYLSYTDWKNGGDLAIRDLLSGTDRVLTKRSSADSAEYIGSSAISRDGRHVAYAWSDGRGREELRVLPVHQRDGSARAVYSNQEITWIVPYDWSPDGKWVAVEVTRRDRTGQIGLVSTADGSFRVLKSIDWRGSGKLALSPDARFLAYQVTPDELLPQRDVYVLAVDGTGEVTAVRHDADDVLVGWNPDGSDLLFSSDRSGTADLWSIAMQDGRPRGTPRRIKEAIGRSWALGVTAAGSIFFGSQSGSLDVMIASIDFTTGRLLHPPVNPMTNYIGSNMNPIWSPDGRSLAYVSRRTVEHFRVVVAIRSTEDQRTREFLPRLIYTRLLQWAPDGRTLLVAGTDLKGRQGIYTLDVATGNETPLLTAEDGEYLISAAWSPDGRRLYYSRQLTPAGVTTFVERHMLSGEEREIARRPTFGLLNLSPDGRYIATRARGGNRATAEFVVIDTESGETRVLLTVSHPQNVSFGGWTPEGRTVLVRISGNAGGNQEWRQVPVSGGEGKPLHLELGVRDLNSPIRVHPDGKRVTYSGGEFKLEVWALENALPASAAARR